MERAPRPGSLPATATADAVAAIYQDHLGMVWGILGRARVLQPELREDLAHDVFVLVHQLYPARNERVPVHAWVAAITWNVIRNHRARERVKREVPMAIPDMHEPAARGASPEEAARDRELLLALVEGMDDDQLAVLDMHAALDIEVPDIARALGIPEGTARTRLRLARAHVKAADARLAARAAHDERRHASARMVPAAVGSWNESARSFEAAPREVAARVWRAVGRTLVSSAALAPVAVTAGAVIAGKSAAALVGLGAVLGGAVVFLATQATQVLTSAEPAPHREVPAAVVGAVSATPSAEPAPSSLPSAAPSVAASSRGAAPPATAVVTVDPEEVALVQQAAAALARKNVDAARAALREHAKRFPHGQLVTERKRLQGQIDRETAPSITPDGGPASHRIFGTDD